MHSEPLLAARSQLAATTVRLDDLKAIKNLQSEVREVDRRVPDVGVIGSETLLRLGDEFRCPAESA